MSALRWVQPRATVSWDREPHSILVYPAASMSEERNTTESHSVWRQRRSWEMINLLAQDKWGRFMDVKGGSKCRKDSETSTSPSSTNKNWLGQLSKSEWTLIMVWESPIYRKRFPPAPLIKRKNTEHRRTTRSEERKIGRYSVAIPCFMEEGMHKYNFYF